MALAVLTMEFVAFAVLSVWGQEVGRNSLAGNVTLTGLPLAIGGVWCWSQN